MNPDRLISLLTNGAHDDLARPGFCPDELQVAGYVDGGLDDTEREQFEQHLADCERCLDLVTMLSQEREADPVEPVSDALLARARRLGSQEKTRKWQWRAPHWAVPQWATAAVLMLAIPLVLFMGREPDRGVVGQGRPESSFTRAFDADDAEIQVLAPQAGASVDPRRSTFQWEAIPGTPYYDVRIVTDDGAVVIQQRVNGNEWSPPAELALVPGAEYYLHVDAYPSGDKAVSSDHVPFRVPD